MDYSLINKFNNFNISDNNIQIRESYPNYFDSLYTINNHLDMSKNYINNIHNTPENEINTFIGIINTTFRSYLDEEYLQPSLSNYKNHDNNFKQELSRIMNEIKSFVNNFNQISIENNLRNIFTINYDLYNFLIYHTTISGYLT